MKENKIVTWAKENESTIRKVTKKIGIGIGCATAAFVVFQAGRYYDAIGWHCLAEKNPELKAVIKKITSAEYKAIQEW